MSDAAIEATDLVREFKKGPRAVDGIDLRVEPGEVLFLEGDKRYDFFVVLDGKVMVVSGYGGE